MVLPYTTQLQRKSPQKLPGPMRAMAEVGKSIKSIKESQPAGITTASMLQPPPPPPPDVQLINTPRAPIH